MTKLFVITITAWSLALGSGWAQDKTTGETSQSDQEAKKPAEAGAYLRLEPTLSQSPEVHVGRYGLHLVPELRMDLTDSLLVSRLPSQLGVSFRQITDNVVRTQLGLGENQGLVVVGADENGIAFQAGLRANHIVAQLDDQPVKTAEDVARAYQRAGQNQVVWAIIDQGQTKRLRISNPQETKIQGETGYRIGVNIKPIDDVLKLHLGITENTGLVITQVFDDSPAQKAGLQIGDVLVAAGKALLPTSAHLNGVTNSSKEQAVKYKYFRKGQEHTVEIAATPKVAPSAIQSLRIPGSYIYSPRVTLGHGLSVPLQGLQVDNKTEIEKRLAELIAKVDELQSEIKSIQKQLSDD